MPNNVIINNIRVTEIPEIYGADALIGMDVMSQGDVAITNYGGKTTFTFETPPFKKIDFVNEIRENNKKIASKLHKTYLLEEKEKGNRLCSCGSGKKYRYCCGKNAKVKN